MILESLEARIAPAAIINVGAPEVSGKPIDLNSFNYKYAPSGQANPFVLESPDFYSVALGTGKGTGLVSQINLYNPGTSFQPWITLSAGEAKAFFTDKNRDGIVESNELTGISYSGNLSMKVAGSVFGDIVGNYSGGSPSANLVSTFKVSIASLQIGGSVDGSIVGAGSLNKVSVIGSLDRLTTHSEAGSTYNFGDGAKALNAYTPAAKVVGGSINSAVLGQVNVVQAGAGGAGAAGGSINGLTIVADTNGMTVLAGKGGADARGGVITNVIVQGAEGNSVGPTPAIKIQSGAGGDSIGAAAGNGGNVSKVYVGYQSIGGKLLPSPVPLANTVEILGGAGGSGVNGGKGGDILTAEVIVKTSDVVGDEIVISAGNGGAGTARDGAGGNINGIRAQNLSFNNALPAQDLDSILVRGGDAGAGAGDGAAGGSVSNVRVLADGVQIFGGNGSSGAKAGGNGGALNAITLDYSEIERAKFVDIQSGSGGSAGSTGRGGAGGNITGVTALLVDLTQDLGPAPSRILAGDGGAGGTGGLGGSLANIRIFEPSRDIGLSAITFEAGDGGLGDKTGGVGGRVTDLAFLGYATSPSVRAGQGGAATAGTGGAGGILGKVVLKTESPVALGLVFAQAGDGGAGSGSNGRGGVGGSLTDVNVQVLASSNVQITAGDGGAGAASTGAGGSISRGGAATSTGSSEVSAGHAGSPTTLTARGAIGGSVSSALAVGSADITIQAGNGAAGGAGGSITRSGWYMADLNLDGSLGGAVAPAGDVKVQAGHGSALGTAAGLGGSIRDVAGFSSANPLKQVTIRAGDGNGAGAPVGGKGAAGGAIGNVYFYGGAAAAVIQAGDGGGATTGNGGNGGSVTNVAGADGVNLLAVSAGNGGAGTRGGLGGSVTKINVFGDIGERTGEVFGFDKMGGIFAGSGGAGATAGKAGNVTDVTAAAISSIVAGRPLSTDTGGTLRLATLVDRIFLRGLDAPTINANGSFSNVTAPAKLPSPGFPNGVPATVNFYEANLVGAIAGNPFLAGANVFKTTGNVPVVSTQETITLSTFQPVDGLVAAETFGQNRNFRAQAVLTVTDPKIPTTFVLLDYRNNYLINS